MYVRSEKVLHLAPVQNKISWQRSALANSDWCADPDSFALNT